MTGSRPDHNSVYVFGPFRLDAQARSLTNEGEPVTITPKVLDTLYLLVRNAGEAVDKEQFFHEIWPGITVEDSNLSQNIFVLRKLLKEKESQCRFIVTVPGRGYRFVFPVETEPLAASDHLRTADETQPTATGFNEPLGECVVQQSPVPVRREKWLRVPGLMSARMVGGGVLGLIVVGVAAALLRVSLRPEPSALQLRAVTAFPGRESAPALSPDGSMVAFIWNEGHDTGTDLFVQKENTSEPTRLTQTAETELSPAWSPDGKRLAFVRLSANALSVHVIDLGSGHEERIRDLYPHRTTYIGRYLAWSPDGRSLAIVLKRSTDDPGTLVLQPLEGNTERMLTQPVSVDQGDSNPAYSYDGHHLAFVRTSAFNSGDVWIVSAHASGDVIGRPWRLTNDRSRIQGLAWSPDSKSIIYSSERNGLQTLSRVSLKAAGNSEALPASGTGAVEPTTSRSGALCFSQLRETQNLWRVDRASDPPRVERLITSTRSQNGPAYSPSGQQIAFYSNRTGTYEIWTAGADGKDQRQITRFGGPLTGSPRWSPDGKWLTFDSRTPEGGADVFVIPSTGGPPVRIVGDSSEDVVPHWSRDGERIFFTSFRTGRSQIWKVRRDGSELVQVTQGGGFYSHEGPDGYLYYGRSRTAPGIWRVPVTGGTEEPVLDGLVRPRFWAHWALAPEGIWFIHQRGALLTDLPVPSMLGFYSLTERAITRSIDLHGNIPPVAPGLAVSPDGRYLLFNRLDESESDLLRLDGAARE